ncbi:MAG: hypothetical protein ACRYFB_08350 [Janthinobacterium lividum]
MRTKPISPKTHSLIDYALASSLLILPPVLNFNSKIKRLYAVEGITLLVYIALTDQPAAIKPIIPFTVHGKIDPYNIGQFALQTFFKPFRKDKKAMIFNICFTAVAGITVLLTDWNGRTNTHP